MVCTLSSVGCAHRTVERRSVDLLKRIEAKQLLHTTTVRKLSIVRNSADVCSRVFFFFFHCSTARAAAHCCTPARLSFGAHTAERTSKRVAAALHHRPLQHVTHREPYFYMGMDLVGRPALSAQRQPQARSFAHAIPKLKQFRPPCGRCFCPSLVRVRDGFSSSQYSRVSS